MKPKKLRKLFRQQFGQEPEKAHFETRAIEGYEGVRTIVSQSGQDQFRQFKRLHNA